MYGASKKNPQEKPNRLYGVDINGKRAVSYAYDDLSRMSSRTLATTQPFVTGYEYLPGAGDTTTLLISGMDNGGEKLTYTYDDVGNIETISRNGELLAKYEYDELSQLIREDNKELGKTVTYEYDQGGNIRSKKTYAYTEGALGTAAKTDTYGYNATNLWADVLTQYNGQTFTYDEIGNPLNYRDGMSFSWQNGRQLSRAQTSEELISYSYNADGIRTRKIRSNGEVTDYYLNGSNIITLITDNIVNPENNVRLDFYYDENSSLLGFAYDGQDYWYVRNGQGDVIGILDKDGNEVVSYTYDSWGAPVSVTGTLADSIGQINPFRYRGYYFDAELGLYYLNSRYYDPRIGRFVNADVFVSAGGGMLSTNMYLYCANNPIHRVDPSGKNFFDTPLSTAALQTMSQTQRDAYYAARRDYLNQTATSPVLPNNIQTSSLTGTPNTTVRIPSKNGDNDIDRHIGENGKADYDIHYGHSHHHPDIGSPHRHNWEWDKDGNPHQGPAIPYPVPASEPAETITIGQKVAAGAVVIGSGIAILYVVANDATGVGVIDDFLLGPLGTSFTGGIYTIFA